MVEISETRESDVCLSEDRSAAYLVVIASIYTCRRNAFFFLRKHDRVMAKPSNEEVELGFRWRIEMESRIVTSDSVCDEPLEIFNLRWNWESGQKIRHYKNYKIFFFLSKL
ncbi:hypothetical protein CEXT_655491 [Caerostris extrusa]|uniref:Uncharacterized protein n=1 Tax=Caerostris extrusa TaxID=172846 RepID=A0AAV4V2C9_CAEEX|nr:hypothetical protein CEXT_655491 [Caerostris extrusa]